MSASETEAESCFIDTNIWLYAFTVGNDLEKTARAKVLIEMQSAVFVMVAWGAVASHPGGLSVGHGTSSAALMA